MTATNRHETHFDHDEPALRDDIKEVVADLHVCGCPPWD